MTFKAFRVHLDDSVLKRGVETLDQSQLPEGDVLIKVDYSSINYKDALSSNGNKGVSRYYPHTPGIDAAGIVEVSTCDKFKTGDRVIVTGYDLGMNTPGGFAEYISVPADWVVIAPESLSSREAMAFGTAGFTAGLSVDKIVANLDPKDGEILVTGGTGGVGSVAISILAKLGYDVVATTGKPEYEDYLLSLGAKRIIHRSEVNDESGKAMLRPLWAGVVDTSGGNVLSTVIKQTHYNGHVTTCGNVGGAEFSSSVYPFILKGITLHGIDSVQCPMAKRLAIWDHLSTDWKVPSLLSSVNEITLNEVEGVVTALLAGTHKGRTIIKF